MLRVHVGHDFKSNAHPPASLNDVCVSTLWWSLCDIYALSAADGSGEEEQQENMAWFGEFHVADQQRMMHILGASNFLEGSKFHTRGKPH